jgi:hypothetical protein
MTRKAGCIDQRPVATIPWYERESVAAGPRMARASYWGWL